MELEKLITCEFILSDQETQLSALTQIGKNGLIKEKLHKQIFEVSKKIITNNSVVDEVTIYNALKEQVDIRDYNRLLEETRFEIQSGANILEHISVLQEERYKEKILAIVDKYRPKLLRENFQEDFEEVKNSLIADLTGLSVHDQSKFLDFNMYKDKIREQLDSDRRIEGFSWGIKDLDSWTSGIVVPRLYVIGGLKKCGKTRFLIHTMKTLYRAGVRSAFISIEVPNYDLCKLLYASFAEINDLRLRTGSLLKKDEREKFEAVNFESKMLGIECKSGLNIEQVLTRIKRYTQLGYKVVFIDYLQRIPYNPSQQAQELENFSTRIADATRQNNVAIILVSQLNAMAEKEIPAPVHLKGSGGIGEAADTIILMDNLYRRTREIKDKNKMDIYIEQRYAESGKLSIRSDLGSCSFTDLYYEKEEAFN